MWVVATRLRQQLSSNVKQVVPDRYATQLRCCRQLLHVAAVGLNGLLARDIEQMTLFDQAVSPAGQSRQQIVNERLRSTLWDQPVLMPRPLQTWPQKLWEAEQAACQLAAKLISQTAFRKAIQADQDSQIQVSHPHTAFPMAKTYIILVASYSFQQAATTCTQQLCLAYTAGVCCM